MIRKKIAVIDSGIGGLTVARKFRELLPGENIIYFGDNINVPYGNKTEDEIYRLTKNMIDFLMTKDIKLIAVACNTISSILDRYFLDCKLPIVSIIEPVTDYIARKKLEKVGVVATSFTIKSSLYERLLKEKYPEIEVRSEDCPSLAEIIDRAEYTDKEIEMLVKLHMSKLLENNNIKDVILGCTHYPIVIDKFKKISPDINFIDPAYQQLVYIKELLDKKNISNNEENSRFEIYTTGDKNIYINMIRALSIEKPDKIVEI